MTASATGDGSKSKSDVITGSVNSGADARNVLRSAEICVFGAVPMSRPNGRKRMKRNGSIQNEADPIKLRRLRLILAREYTRVSNYAAAETICRDEFERDQDDPTPLISLAEQKLYYEEQPASAMPIIDEAIQTAYRSGIYR